MEDPFKKFLQDEFNKEADFIEREVMEDSSLDDIQATPEMYTALAKKIEEYEGASEKEKYQELSKEEQEWLRIGKEIKEKEKIKVTYKRPRFRKRKGFILAAIMLLLMVGAGISSVGGPQHLMDIMNQAIGNRSMVQVDSGENEAVKSGVSDEETAYQDIKDSLGFDAVRMGYVPEETTFLSQKIDRDVQKVALFYDISGNIMIYKMRVSYRDGAFALEIEDELEKEYSLDVSGVKVLMKTYRVKETNEKMQSAQFEYKNIQYFLSGVAKQEEFEKIVKNLKFF